LNFLHRPGDDEIKACKADEANSLIGKRNLSQEMKPHHLLITGFLWDFLNKYELETDAIHHKFGFNE
jgi:hypothetical protein